MHNERIAYNICLSTDIIALIVSVAIMYHETIQEQADEPTVLLAFIVIITLVVMFIYVTNNPPTQTFE